MKFDKYVILEKRDDFNDKKTVMDAVKILEQALESIHRMYGKTYNKDVGTTMNSSVMHLKKAIEEWKQIEL